MTSAPMPLSESSVTNMTLVAPGQSTELYLIDADGWEAERADRIEVEFRQGGVTVISEVTDWRRGTIQIPARLKPGRVAIRTRTWIEQTASSWSRPVAVTLPDRTTKP